MGGSADVARLLLSHFADVLLGRRDFVGSFVDDVTCAGGAGVGMGVYYQVVRGEGFNCGMPTSPPDPPNAPGPREEGVKLFPTLWGSITVALAARAGCAPATRSSAAQQRVEKRRPLSGLSHATAWG